LGRKENELAQQGETIVGKSPQATFACFRLKTAMLCCAEGELVGTMNKWYWWGTS